MIEQLRLDPNMWVPYSIHLLAHYRETLYRAIFRSNRKRRFIVIDYQQKPNVPHPVKIRYIRKKVKKGLELVSRPLFPFLDLLF